MTARIFINCAADVDRWDKRLKQISHKGSLTMGKTGNLSKGLCRGLYRKADNINRHITQIVSAQLVRWAKDHSPKQGYL